MKNSHPLPQGWEKSRTGACVVHKNLDGFRHAEVHYDADRSRYVLYETDCDGPRRRWERSIHEDIGKAMKAGDKL